MTNKFENEHDEEKLFKKRLLDRTLHDNSGPNLCFSLYMKILVFGINTYYLKLS